MMMLDIIFCNFFFGYTYLGVLSQDGWMDTTALAGLDKNTGLGRVIARRKESGFSAFIVHAKPILKLILS